MLDGLARAGVVGTIKHMPGNGRTSVDTHKALPTITSTDAELEIDLAPFKALKDTPIGMTGHLLFQAWDPVLPSTQSPFVINEIIRKRIGFSGLLLTDDLDMEALSGTVPERAEASVKAGCDIALNCWAKRADMEGICARLPSMPEMTANRLEQALKGMGIANRSADYTELVAKRDALLALLDAESVKA